MVIKTIKMFTLSDNGKLIPYAYGTVYVVTDDLGASLISSGLAVEYDGLVAEPTQTKDVTIVENSVTDVDVAEYASVQVTVDLPNGNEVEY